MQENRIAKEIFKSLAEPFIKTLNGKVYPDIKWLPKDGKSMKDRIICMPYLSGGQVRDRLNEILGLEGWSIRSKLETDSTRTVTLSIFVDGVWIDRDGVGTRSREEGEKGADTDALKRAARNFGIGAYLEQIGHRFVPAKAGRNGKPAPVDNNGRFLYSNQLHDFLNGYSTEQGLLAQILIMNPKAWDITEFKELWKKFNL